MATRVGTSNRSAPTSNRSPTRGTRAIASTCWSISSSSPSAASSAAATARPPSIAGPPIGPIGSTSSWRCPTASPRATASAACSWPSSPRPSRRCFQAWIADAIPTDDGGPARLVAIDGKTCRRSHDAAKGLGPLHIVSAWASEEGIALGQVATDAKSNEITAIPQLLEQIDLAGTLITIDAMGCQKEIARDIVAGGGDFVIAVKDNQPKLAGRSGRSSRSTWNATWKTSGTGTTRRTRTGTAASTSGRTSSPRCRRTSRPRRTGRGSRRSATRCGSPGTPTAARVTRCGTTSAAAISAASGSARRCAATGASSRCTGCWT